jgi:hypothetical protein
MLRRKFTLAGLAPQGGFAKTNFTQPLLGLK